MQPDPPKPRPKSPGLKNPYRRVVTGPNYGAHAPPKVTSSSYELGEAMPPKTRGNADSVFREEKPAVLDPVQGARKVVEDRVERQEMADRAKTERQHALYLKALQNDKW